MNRHRIVIFILGFYDKLQIMTTVDTINQPFLDFLRNSFSACEWYGLICRCFGPHNTAFPALFAQDEYTSKMADWAYRQPINRFFFEELLRLRPQHRGCIYIRMDELELTIRRRLDDDDGLEIMATGLERFVFDPENGTYRDVLTDVAHSHFQMDITALDLVYRQQVFEDILLLSQLPMRTVQKVTAVECAEDRIHIFSTAHGVPLALQQLSAEDDPYLQMLAEALDAAHQRDVYHGPIRSEHLRCSDSGELILGGFGEAAFQGRMLTLEDDHKAMANLLEQIFPKGSLLDRFCIQLRSGQWHQSILELVQAVEASFEESDLIPLEEKPAKLILESPNRISVQIGFQDVVQWISFRKVGQGELSIESKPLPPWLKLIPSRIDPNVTEQELELTILTKKLPQSHNQFSWTIKDNNADEITIYIEAKRSTWLMPALILFVFVAIAGLLILGRLAS